MKRMIITLLAIMLTIVLKAPDFRALPIIMYEGINKYDPLIKAVTWVESNHGLFIWNETEQAVGSFQIRPCRVEDYNKRTGSNYKLEDFYDYELSKKMFLYFAKDKSFEKAARDWNGSGPMTTNYWKKVKKYLCS